MSWSTKASRYHYPSDCLETTTSITLKRRCVWQFSLQVSVETFENRSWTSIDTDLWLPSTSSFCYSITTLDNWCFERAWRTYGDPLAESKLTTLFYFGLPIYFHDFSPFMATFWRLCVCVCHRFCVTLGLVDSPVKIANTLTITGVKNGAIDKSLHNWFRLSKTCYRKVGDRFIIILEIIPKFTSSSLDKQREWIPGRTWLVSVVASLIRSLTSKTSPVLPLNVSVELKRALILIDAWPLVKTMWVNIWTVGCYRWTLCAGCKD